MRVIVAGGGKVGFYLATTLQSRKHRVTIIERDQNRCLYLAEHLNVLVIEGDASHPAVLGGAGAEEADTVVAVTGKDEENYLICQMAKRRFRVPRVVARASNPQNQRVLRKLGIDEVVSGTGIIADVIERELTSEAVKTLLTFHQGDMTLLEIRLPSGAPGVGRAVWDLARDLPQDLVLTSVIRGERVIFPRGDTVLQAHDSVLAVTTHASEQVLRDVLLGVYR